MKRDCADVASQLCPHCGFCCNGVLFDDVRLQKGEKIAKLTAAGLVFERVGGHRRFRQPCPAFDGSLCRVYNDRPCYCRQFECQLFQEVRRGQRPLASARRAIQQARRQAQASLKLLRELGQNDESLSLTERYRQVFEAPWDLSGDPAICRKRDRLLRSVHQLTLTLEQIFGRK